MTHAYFLLNIKFIDKQKKVIYKEKLNNKQMNLEKIAANPQDQFFHTPLRSNRMVWSTNKRISPFEYNVASILTLQCKLVLYTDPVFEDHGNISVLVAIDVHNSLEQNRHWDDEIGLEILGGSRANACTQQNLKLKHTSEVQWKSLA